LVVVIKRTALRLDEWYSLEDSVPCNHDGLVHRSRQITVEVNKAGRRRLERSHPVCRSPVCHEVKTAGSAVLPVHLQTTTRRRRCDETIYRAMSAHVNEH